MEGAKKGPRTIIESAVCSSLLGYLLDDRYEIYEIFSSWRVPWRVPSCSRTHRYRRKPQPVRRTLKTPLKTAKTWRFASLFVRVS